MLTTADASSSICSDVVPSSTSAQSWRLRRAALRVLPSGPHPPSPNVQGPTGRPGNCGRSVGAPIIIKNDTLTHPACTPFTTWAWPRFAQTFLQIIPPPYPALPYIPAEGADCMHASFSTRTFPRAHASPTNHATTKIVARKTKSEEEKSEQEILLSTPSSSSSLSHPPVVRP